MPKKSRKMKQRAAMRRTAEQVDVPVIEEGAPATEQSVVRMRPTFTSARTALQDYDYSHIYGDLKRIALFASFFFIVLIVLSFVIK